jgi:hypothetical protein
LGFALTEAIALFALMMGFLILFVFWGLIRPRLASDSARGLGQLEWISWRNRVTRDGIEVIRRVCLLPEDLGSTPAHDYSEEFVLDR